MVDQEARAAARNRILRDRYPDLLDAGSTAGAGDEPAAGNREDLLPILADLDAALATGQPPANLAASLRTPTKPRRRLSIHMTWPKLSAPIAASVAVVLVAISALAVGVANRGIRDWGAQSVEDQMVAVDLTQTANGYAIHIEKAYADSNRLIVAYSVAPPAGEVDDGVGIYSARATTSTGAALPLSMNIIAPVYSGSSVGLMSFDTSTVRDAPDSIAIHLDVLELWVVGSNNPKRDAHDQMRFDVQASFDFTVPFVAGRSSTPNVSASVQGRVATVERVVVAPSETRVYLAVAPIQPTWAELRDAAGHAVQISTFDSTPNGVVLVFSSPPPNGGDWTLSVGDAPVPNGWPEPGSPRWTFTFPAP